MHTVLRRASVLLGVAALAGLVMAGPAPAGVGNADPFAGVAKRKSGPYEGIKTQSFPLPSGTVAKVIDPGETRNFFFKVKNKGDGGAVYHVLGIAFDACIKAKVFLGKNNVTEKITTAGLFRGYQPGQKRTFKAKVKAKDCHDEDEGLGFLVDGPSAPPDDTVFAVARV